MSGEQIKKKRANGRLRGTRVYGASIDRSKEPESQKRRVSQSSQTLSTFMMKTKMYNTSLQEFKLECLKAKDMTLLN